jgi:hypothetical protein
MWREANRIEDRPGHGRVGADPDLDEDPVVPELLERPAPPGIAFEDNLARGSGHRPCI